MQLIGPWFSRFARRVSISLNLLCILVDAETGVAVPRDRIQFRPAPGAGATARNLFNPAKVSSR
jgi:hypothetical protein